MNIKRVRKKFCHREIEFRIVEVEETYMNSDTLINITRVIAPNDRHLPITIGRRDTLKAIIEKSIASIETFVELGANLKEECC